MKEPTWIINETVLPVHSLLLAEHGGGVGIRDEGLLESALSRPIQKFSHEPKPSIFELAASYSFGLAKNHPFVDGNKRTAFTVGTLFLELNGYRLTAPEPIAAVAFEDLASGKLSESELANWFEEHCSKASRL
ncbi:MAG: type II toxin-antitoxin system death-on-curing family toxin [Gammaproteobacteria bacterium]|nr:MAG: type II toxin-antitoxin system death-on-curing family toxin [Gammaproteobacteria bacterium]RLA54844.1 MAG: type II toxin-antitoxin system death-on-curing family toxin [Gammaproteobacteria bacterium]